MAAAIAPPLDGEAQALPDPERSIWTSKRAIDVEKGMAGDGKDDTSPLRSVPFQGDGDTGSVKV